MKSLVLLAVFCVIVVNANHQFNGGGFYPYYIDGYVVEHYPLRPLGHEVQGAIVALSSSLESVMDLRLMELVRLT